jgi:hypothetical protein
MTRLGAAAAESAIAVDLRDAAGNGRADPTHATPLFRRALATVAAHGGGTIYVPPGEWVVDEAVRIATPGTTLRGAGVRASRIRVRDKVLSHGIAVEASSVIVERLTVVGNRKTVSKPPGHHGIRLGGDQADWIVLRDLAVEDAQAYGIGLEKGSFESIVIENVSVSRSGADGIDFKNSENTGTRCFLRNITVEESGMGSAGKAGIDVRGRVRLQNIDVLAVGPGQAGVRFRDSSKTGRNGVGGLWSSVGNFFITKSHRAGEAIQNPDQQGVSIGNGTVVEPEGHDAVTG